MSAFGLIILVPFAFVLEGHSFMDTLTEHMENAARGHPTLASIGRTATWVLLINMFLAFGYTLSQYWMTKVTSAVTSQVVGTSKNAVLSTISFLFFGDTITVPAFLGYLTVFGGAGVYTYLRIHGHTATAPVYAPLSAGGTRVAEA